MKNRLRLSVALFLAIGLAVIGAKSPSGKDPGSTSSGSGIATSAPQVVATVGARRVDEADLRWAARVFRSDPLRKQDPASWRRMLLDRAVDRELLAAEAERRGFDKDPDVKARIASREYLMLWRRLYDQVLVPGITPSPEELKRLRDEGIYRGVDLYYILIRDDARGGQKAVAERVLTAARAGARWDSLAKIYSGHPPSQVAGGHFGWILEKELAPASYKDLRAAKPGDVLGLYTSPMGHEIYKVGAFDNPSNDSLLNVISNERRSTLELDYMRGVLRKYHFALDSLQAKAALFAIATEPADSIVASLGPDGTRPKRGVRPALGAIARYDGGSLTLGDVVRAAPPSRNEEGEMKVSNIGALYYFCARAILPELTARDATDQGLGREPAVARELRLMRDQIRTEAMVRKNAPPIPGDSELRAYFASNVTRYQRPRATTAHVASFDNPDSAARFLAECKARGMTDSLLTLRGIRTLPGLTPVSIHPGYHAVLTFYERDADSLSRSVQRIPTGQLGHVLNTPRGYVVAQVLSVEKPRPFTFDEVRLLVRQQWEEDAENTWVTRELVRLRAETPVRVTPGRLEATKLTWATISEGGAR